MRKILLILALTVMLVAPAKAREIDMVRALFGCFNVPVCFISNNPGGFGPDFEMATKQASKHTMRFEIDGVCDSGCLMFASKVRNKVCITENARMGIHRGVQWLVYDHFGREVPLNQQTLRTYFNPPPGFRVEFLYRTPDYGTDIEEWALREGKMPYDGVYRMTLGEASQFWRLCSRPRRQ